MSCPTCGAQIPEDALSCPNCSASIPTEENTALAVLPELPMAWYHFLVRLGLWIGGAIILLVGLAELLGLPYTLQGMDAGLVYAALPPLMLLDFAYGLIGVVCGILLFVARFRLAAFRRSGPVLLYVSYGLVVASSVVYSMLSRALISPEAALFGITELSQLVGMVAGIVLNMIYFNKRSYLFYQK